MSDQKPREWTVFHEFDEGPAWNGPDPEIGGVKVIEKSAFDVLAKENAALKHELKMTMSLREENAALKVHAVIEAQFRAEEGEG